MLDTAGSSIAVTSNPTLCLGNCSLNANLAFAQGLPLALGALNVGQSLTFDFANIVVRNGFGVGSATLEAVLALASPAGSLSTGGTANYVRFGGLFTTGSLNWANQSQSIVAGNGSKYTVKLNNLAGTQLGNRSTVTGTISFDSVSAVPEPATWAMMLVGFGLIGGTMRRQGKVRTKVSFA